MEVVITGIVTNAQVPQSGEPSPGYFDADQSSDILWRNTASGEMVVWYMDGPHVRASTVVGSGPGSGWKIVNVP